MGLCKSLVCSFSQTHPPPTKKSHLISAGTAQSVAEIAQSVAETARSYSAANGKNVQQPWSLASQYLIQYLTLAFRFSFV